MALRIASIGIPLVFFISLRLAKTFVAVSYLLLLAFAIVSVEIIAVAFMVLCFGSTLVYVLNKKRLRFHNLFLNILMP